MPEKWRGHVCLRPCGFRKKVPAFPFFQTGSQAHIEDPLPRLALASLTQRLAALLENRGIATLVQSDDGSHIGWITLDDVTEALMEAP